MTNFSLRRTAGLAAVALCVAGAAACRRQQAEPPPVATPSFSVNQTRVPLGSPVEVTYKFTVAKDAPKINENYRVFVHFLDSDKERMWTDDHDLPVPTTQWKPGQVIEYTKTMFVPIYPYMGQTKVLMGLYSQASNSRLPLAGENNGQRAYTDDYTGVQEVGAEEAGLARPQDDTARPVVHQRPDLAKVAGRCQPALRHHEHVGAEPLDLVEHVARHDHAATEVAELVGIPHVSGAAKITCCA